MVEVCRAKFDTLLGGSTLERARHVAICKTAIKAACHLRNDAKEAPKLVAPFGWDLGRVYRFAKDTPKLFAILDLRASVGHLVGLAAHAACFVWYGQDVGS